ncbi:hypothetical protein TWF730_003677 [Orbilia blumenaviensis]|uniref:Uncharacterized protein n=1 Tax=Orbilia blumenaviensis TaxID=1796055 RepID=A0AAV9U3E6_9PEZI
MVQHTFIKGMEGPSEEKRIVPHCRNSIRSRIFSDAFGGVASKEPQRPALCSAELMRRAVLLVPKYMDEYFVWWLDETCGENGIPQWYPWYRRMLSVLHRHRHWHVEGSTRWEFSELAAALDPEYENLRCSNPAWVVRPELTLCVDDLKKYQVEMRKRGTPVVPKAPTTAHQDVIMGISTREIKINFVSLCYRSPEDDTVVQYDEEWSFDWGEYTSFETDYWGGELAKYVATP